MDSASTSHLDIHSHFCFESSSSSCYASGCIASPLVCGSRFRERMSVRSHAPSVRLAINHLLRTLGIAGTLHRDRRGSLVEAIQIVWCEFHCGCAKVLFQAVQLRGAGNRHDPGLLRQNPRERDLSRSRILLLGKTADQIYERLVRLAIFLIETRHSVAEVARIKLCLFCDFAREESLAERAERYEADSEFFQWWAGSLVPALSTTRSIRFVAR